MGRFHKAIFDGVRADALTQPIDDRLNRKKALEKLLAEIAMAKERLLRIPEVSEKMVDEAISKIQDMFESTNS